jgi:hypothetical protein
MLEGKRYRRIRYGKEPVPEDFRTKWQEIITRPCHDCEVILGELHLSGCDMERCPRCARQYRCCEYMRDDDPDESVLVAA